jgi:hypothetical protein
MSRYENSDWQLGMPLPSRKETHGRKKKKQKPNVPLNPERGLHESRGPADTYQLQDDHSDGSESTGYREDRAARMRELQAAREEAAAAAAVLPIAPEAAGEVPAGLPETEVDPEPVIGKWTYRLLMFFIPVILIVVLAYGKLGYVHQVPKLVRENVPAYEQGEGFLILKPWWFGPPVYALDEYGEDATDFQRYRLNLHDFKGIVEEPVVLWRFQKDVLQN